MAERQEAERRVGVAEHRQTFSVYAHGSIHAAMGQHCAFGFSGGAGCVDEREDVVGRGCLAACGHGLAAHLRRGFSQRYEIDPPHRRRIVGIY